MLSFPLAWMLRVVAAGTLMLCLVSCTQPSQNDFKTAKYADNIEAIGIGGEYVTVYLGCISEQCELPHIFIKGDDGVAYDCSALTVEEAKRVGFFELRKWNEEGKVTLDMRSGKSEAIFRDGRLHYILLESHTPCEIARKENGPFVKLPCEYEAFEDAFGEPNDRGSYPVMTP